LDAVLGVVPSVWVRVLLPLLLLAQAGDSSFSTNPRENPLSGSRARIILPGHCRMNPLIITLIERFHYLTLKMNSSTDFSLKDYCNYRDEILQIRAQLETLGITRNVD